MPASLISSLVARRFGPLPPRTNPTWGSKPANSLDRRILHGVQRERRFQAFRVVPDTFVQSSLDWDTPSHGQRERTKLMKAMDQVNDRFGKRTGLLGSSDLTHGAETWGMRQVR